MKKIVSVFTLLILISSCDFKRSEPVTIAVNPWPGYGYLYIADELGYFEQQGLNIHIASFDSLADGQRAYIHGRVDGLASSIVESVQAHYLSHRPLKLILFSDYSNGGDVIVARKDIQSVHDLAGKNIGCEVGSLGIFMAQRALAQSGMSLDDVYLFNVEQSDAELAMLNEEIDAYVTYPPVSMALLLSIPSHVVFSSAEIPFEIVDTISVAESVLKENPSFARRFRQAWQQALDYAETNPLETMQIMTTKLGMPEEDISSMLADIKVLGEADQKKIFAQHEEIAERVELVCQTLVHVNALESKCENPDIMVLRER